MSIFGTLQTAVSGMAAQANRMGTIGDNIANASTTGYKNAGSEFETMVGNEGANSYESGGVQTRVRYSIADQGEISGTSSVTDLAIKGSGFFLVKDSSGATLMTRAGSFVPDATGDLVNTAGDVLMGYNLQDGSYDAKSGTGTLSAVNVASQSLSATPSKAGVLSVNLPSTATAVPAANLPSTNSASATYTAKTSLVTYDDVGKAVNLDIYLTKSNTNTWEAAVYDASGAASGGGFPYSSPALTTQTLNFDPTTGHLASTSGSSLSVPIPNGSTVSIDMSNSTELAAAYQVSDATVDGNAPSKVSSITIGTDGTLSTVYASGATASTFRIPLGNVQSPDNLSVLSGNCYQANSDSGAMTVGTAGAGGLGDIDSSSLESSTVDLATELTQMISTQRSYEANSKVLTTGSAMLSTIIQAIQA